MNLLARLFRKSPDPREALRPLWRRTVEISREPEWYANAGVADTTAGRFDMVTAVLSLVILRMETDPDLARDTAYLTELFVEDMDGQLRQGGVGDVVVGKHMGKLMSTLGGRLGAYREGLASADGTCLEAAVERNMTLLDGASIAAMEGRLRQLATDLARTDAAHLIAGRIGR